MNYPIDYASLAESIKAWGRELGFAEIRVGKPDLWHAEACLQTWLDEGRHGDMEYMAAHGLKRARPEELVPGTQRVICARMDYLPHDAPDNWREYETARLHDPSAAVISIYARGRDYHRVLRNRLQQLANRIEQEIGVFTYRAFTDSAPIMEVALAEQAGLGWRGKHTLLLQQQTGSLFFLGELLVDLPLPIDSSSTPHCGTCHRCIDICPTQAITAPYQLDARRCISYLTIEHKGKIPESLRPLIGNRIYGCDACQLVCPWNKFAQKAAVPDFTVRNDLSNASLIDLFKLSEEVFLQRFEGSPIRRIGHERWLRNIAVAMGNALRSEHLPEIERALHERAGHPSSLVREHVSWALKQALPK